MCVWGSLLRWVEDKNWISRVFLSALSVIKIYVYTFIALTLKFLKLESGQLEDWIS